MKKSILQFLGLTAILSAVGTAYSDHKKDRRHRTQRERMNDYLFEHKVQAQMAAPIQAEAKGLKPFNFNGITVYALNQKNALKKFEKQLQAA